MPSKSKKPKLRVVGSAAKKNGNKLSSVEKRYYAALHLFVDSVFARACDEYDWSWADLASAAQLSYSTVLNLGNRVTRLPRYMTIFKLAQAVGMELQLQEPPKKSAAKLKAVG